MEITLKLTGQDLTAISIACEDRLCLLVSQLGLEEIKNAHKDSNVYATVRMWNLSRSFIGYGSRDLNTFPSDIYPNFFDRKAFQDNLLGFGRNRGLLLGASALEPR